MGRNRRDKSDRRKKVEEKPDQRKLIKTQPPSKNDQILRDVVCSIRNGYFLTRRRVMAPLGTDDDLFAFF